MPNLPLVNANPNQLDLIQPHLPVPNDPIGVLINLILNEVTKRATDKKIDCALKNNLERAIEIANNQDTSKWKKEINPF